MACNGYPKTSHTLGRLDPSGLGYCFPATAPDLRSWIGRSPAPTLLEPGPLGLPRPTDTRDYRPDGRAYRGRRPSVHTSKPRGTSIPTDHSLVAAPRPPPPVPPARSPLPSPPRPVPPRRPQLTCHIAHAHRQPPPLWRRERCLRGHPSPVSRPTRGRTHHEREGKLYTELPPRRPAYTGQPATEGESYAGPSPPQRPQPPPCPPPPRPAQCKSHNRKCASGEYTWAVCWFESSAGRLTSLQARHRRRLHVVLVRLL